MSGAGATPRETTGAGLAVHDRTPWGNTVRDEPTATQEIADDDRKRARELLTALGLSWPLETEINVARLLAETREAGFAAGLEERADDAHLAGYREGVEAALAVAAREYDAAEAIRRELLEVHS